MSSFIEAEKAAQKFSELPFFNRNFMTVAIGKEKELLVYLFKKIRVDNLPIEFEGYTVRYNYMN